MSAVALFDVASIRGATRYVDGVNGSDSASGLAPAAAYRTIGRACQVVLPGDTVIVLPGVYFEHVELTRSGTAQQPITFQADQLGKNRVVISGADPALREGTAAWQLDDPAAQLYSTTLAQLPGRVLYDEIDLYRYDSLEELKVFQPIRSGVATPGPQHGWYFDSVGRRLYVRLHPSGRYGSLSPIDHVMKVGPPGAAGTYGTEIDKPSDYNFAIATSQPAHVILDGFTFETPGFAGVWVHRGSATVRNCWFRGCRAAVSGWAANDPRRPTAEVLVQFCDVTEEPTTADAEEVIAIAESLPPDQQAALPNFYWWHRKSPSLTSYQGGAFNALGAQPRILNCYLHEVLDGVSVFAVDFSDGGEIAYNRFERILDNAVECENHAQNLRVHDNEVRDVFEPFSYQPQSGLPWPAGVWFYQNVVTCSPAWTELWRKPVVRWTPGCFKIKVPTYFTTPARDGMVVWNNTLFFPSGDLFTLTAAAANAANFHFFNNIAVSRGLAGSVPSTELPNWELVRNVTAPAQDGEQGPGAIFAGTGGRQVSSPEMLALAAPFSGDVTLGATSPAIGPGEVRPAYPDTSTTAGALVSGEAWLSPEVGPRVGVQPELYQTWMERMYPHDLRNSVRLNPAATSPVSGRTNLIDYALGLPLAGVGNVTTSLDSAGLRKISYTRPEPAPLDLSYALEAGDLATGHWNSADQEFAIESVSPIGDGRARVELIQVAGSSSDSPQVYRLRISQQPPPVRPAITYPPWVPPVDPTGTTIVLDGFEDGDRGTSNANSMEWWKLSPTNGGATPVLTVVDAASGLGSGKALLMDNDGKNTNLFSNKSFVAAFPAQTLTKTGDQIVLTFDVCFTRIFAPDVNNLFRFGLYDSRGTKIVQDNRSSPAADDAGYTASISFGDAAGRSCFTREAGTEGGILQDDCVPLGVDISGVFSLKASGVKTSARLAIERTDDGVRLSVRICDGSGNLLIEGSETDTGAAFTTFDEIIFSTVRMEADYLIDNVKVTKVHGP